MATVSEVVVKVDGITNNDDAYRSAEAGADVLGFVFGPSSRRVDPETVWRIVKFLPAEVLSVGVFVDENPRKVVKTMRAAGLEVAQLHGKEAAKEARWIGERVQTVWKAFAAGDPEVQHAADYGIDTVIVDSPMGGGTGRAYDWSLIGDIPKGIRLILAGGLTPENVADAIKAVRPWGVDVSSGVESSPGRKDPQKLKAFVAAANSALRP